MSAHWRVTETLETCPSKEDGDSVSGILPSVHRERDTSPLLSFPGWDLLCRLRWLLPFCLCSSGYPGLGSWDLAVTPWVWMVEGSVVGGPLCMTARDTLPPPESLFPQGAWTLYLHTTRPPIPIFGTANGPAASSLSVNFHLIHPKRKTLPCDKMRQGLIWRRNLEFCWKKTRKTILKKKKKASFFYLKICC